MTNIKIIRAKLIQNNRVLSGIEGERFAKDWLNKSGWKWLDVSQDQKSMSKELRLFGGKRPDFIVECDDGTTLLLDAKYHSTGGGKYFRMKIDEINQYMRLLEFLEEKFSGKFELVFMLFPKEFYGDKLLLIGLGSLGSGNIINMSGDDAVEINIEQDMKDKDICFDL